MSIQTKLTGHMKKFLALGMASLLGSVAFADSLKVDTFDYYGPFPVMAPLMIDSVDVNGKKFLDENLSSAPASLTLPELRQRLYNVELTPVAESPAVHILSFDFENGAYATPTISVKGLGDNATI